MRRIRVLVPLTVLLATVASLTACGEDSEPTPAGTSAPQTIAVTIEGDTIEPNGERIEVEIGQPVEFVVTADAEGELHVHSDPEQELAYEKGTTILEIGPFDKAGIVEVESHDQHATVVQLEVK
ncbi:MAG TPA: hypothetical protein VGE38_08775 [Nocardioides sp.]|uniref:hypothetical protein n=1 Tax=Nocardioides sp. TaxID=35761 RepID=UPI002ED8437C